MRNAAVAANGANVQVNTHSAAKKYNAPTALVPEIARSVAAAPKINNGVASGSTSGCAVIGVPARAGSLVSLILLMALVLRRRRAPR